MISLNPRAITYIRKRIYAKKRKWIPYYRIRKIVIMVAIVYTAVSVGFISVSNIIYDREKIEFLDVGQGDGIIINAIDPPCDILSISK